MIQRALLGIWMAAVIVGAFLIAPVAKNLGELSRIVYFHVPVAWVAVLAFLWAMVQGILLLRSNRMVNDIAAEAAARIGLSFCILATLTGMVFAKATWGAYWNWDPRETSVFVLLLIYLAYFALRTAIEDPERRARLAAAYAILAGFAVPFLVFIIPRVYFSLHPTPIISKTGKLEMDHTMLIVFLSSLAGFTGIYVWLQNLSVRAGILARRAEEESE